MYYRTLIVLGCYFHSDFNFVYLMSPIQQNVNTELHHHHMCTNKPFKALAFHAVFDVTNIILSSTQYGNLQTVNFLSPKLVKRLNLPQNISI